MRKRKEVEKLLIVVSEAQSLKRGSIVSVRYFATSSERLAYRVAGW